ncbi:MAG TPA: toll/interleukin-1 receptor domain-containing protein [Chthoniobacterales bacterium]|nr:toll/interleukin-1 receptor domain-containing protein [Chthoniobacterales bacterium]
MAEWNEWRRESEEDPNLVGANLEGADLSDANLNQADLSCAKLSGANLMAASLFHANLSGASLSGANLGVANLNGADLSDTNLSSANLGAANLSGAQFINAFLVFANLGSADLSGANLSQAHLGLANLGGANLSGANLQNAITVNTRFADCDLGKTKGLSLVDHQGPSTIGVDTIYKSRGKIPESFLRGCGVPEGLIMQMHSLLGAEDGIQFYSCFISYSGNDEDFARRLHGKMRDAHLRVWFAPEDIHGGKKLHEQIETAIRIYDKLLIVLSKASLQSEWVMTELRKAHKAERQNSKRKLFPVRLVDFETLRNWECFDPETGKDLAVELREYFIPDFSNWKDHDQFEAAFDRLLKDLRAEDRATSF